MKLYAAALLAAPLLCVCGKRLAQSDPVVEIGSQVVVSAVERFGVNVGLRTSWGAEQLMSNVIMNPGFEGVVDRTLVFAGRVGLHRFSDDSARLARPDSFWAGAGYDVRTGDAAGQKGRIIDSRGNNKDGLPDFTTEGEFARVAPGDVIALTRVSETEALTQWWVPEEAASQVGAQERAPPPRSKGRRSAVLRPRSGHPATLISYLDAIGERAGKMLPIRGDWRLAFWSRGQAGTRLSVRFRREGSAAFLQRDLTPQQNWTLHQFEFTASDEGPAGILELRFEATGDGELLLDDVSLQNEADAGFPFRSAVVDTLQQLHPGYLRDWQGQLGDTLENRLASADARRSWRYRPGGAESTDFGYSLPEFLDLCVRVGAKPWVVAPTTFSDQEWVDLGGYLRDRWATDHFPEIVVEFGNENWNPIFRPAGIADPARHGEASERALANLRKGAGGLPLRWAVNGQHANVNFALRFLAESPSASLLAVAPYLLPDLRGGLSAADRTSLLFAGDEGRLQQLASGASQAGRELAVAEINLHTLGGDATAAERDPIVGGACAGAALAKRLLEGLKAGARRQCVYTLAQFDAREYTRDEYVRLWGIVRDLGETRRMRSTGLALQMLNQAIGGDLHSVRGGDSALLVSPFRTSAGWTVAVVSSCGEPKEVVLRFPAAMDAPLPQRLLRLAGKADATNEDSEQVRIAAENLQPTRGVIRFVAPAWGLVILLPKEKP